MNNIYMSSAMSIALCASASISQAETQKTENEATKDDVLLRVQTLEQRIQEMEATQYEQQTPGLSPTRRVSNSAFNPAISVILDGVYASYKNDPEDYSLPGYTLGGEAELAPEGTLG